MTLAPFAGSIPGAGATASRSPKACVKRTCFSFLGRLRKRKIKHAKRVLKLASSGTTLGNEHTEVPGYVLGLHTESHRSWPFLNLVLNLSGKAFVIGLIKHRTRPRRDRRQASPETWLSSYKTLPEGSHPQRRSPTNIFEYP